MSSAHVTGGTLRCRVWMIRFVQDQLTHIKRLREAIQDETAVFTMFQSGVHTEEFYER